MLLATAQDKLVEEHGKLLEKEGAIYKKHKEEQMEMYRVLFPLVRAQQRAISNHIRALANG